MAIMVSCWVTVGSLNTRLNFEGGRTFADSFASTFGAPL